MRFRLSARTPAEFVGTAFLLAAVVGSGIMGERLSGGNVAIALLANTIATGAALVALILTFGPVFNPAVTLADASQRGSLRTVQLLGLRETEISECLRKGKPIQRECG
jgi:glycerol uptake facilitator-like aquaporin